MNRQFGCESSEMERESARVRANQRFVFHSAGGHGCTDFHGEGWCGFSAAAHSTRNSMPWCVSMCVNSHFCGMKEDVCICPHVYCWILFVCVHLRVLCVCVYACEERGGCPVVDAAVLCEAMARDKIHVNDVRDCAGRGGEGGVLWLTLFCARLWHVIRSM